MANDKFERIEKKFWMNAEQYQKIEPVLKEHMEVDKFGLSKIRNIYCDTDDYILIRKSIERPKFKEKLRIRSYTAFEQDSQVFVEIKRKLNGIGYKRRIQIPFKDALRLLDGQPVQSENPQIAAEMLEFARRYHPKPKVYLSYERVAMFGKENASLRITVDRNIRYSLYEEGTDLEGKSQSVITDASKYALMEVKAFGAIPEWLVTAMSYLHIYRAPFSKIGTCFTDHIAPSLTLDKHI